MTIDVSVEATIERSPDMVFEQVAAVDAWPAWLIASGIKAVHRSGSGPLARGERLVVEQQVAGRAGRFAAEVTDIEPPTRLAIHGRDDDGIGIEFEASVAPAGLGTALRWTIRIDLPLRLRLFEGIARPQVEQAARLDLEALRRRLESGAGH
ncbi:MAG TPA: SRPBCC family protein [Candidatus Limnocylindrales bacterium]|jgi:uncharacterized protein YndB with AHSA1/START domain|nr:SRPBCC family protein [Candidatus Limnocylindrales bacterium]